MRAQVPANLADSFARLLNDPNVTKPFLIDGASATSGVSAGGR